MYLRQYDPRPNPDFQHLKNTFCMYTCMYRKSSTTSGTWVV